MTTKTVTPKEIALEWGISPKTLRKFLRKDEKVIAAVGGETPGKGGRWAIPANQVKTLRKRFDAWVAANKAEKEDAVVTAPESPEGDATPLDALMHALEAMPEVAPETA